MRGPLNPSLNDSAGLLIDGFDDAPFLLMPYNPPEYAKYVENAGYEKVKDLYAWIYELALFNPKVAELAERVKKRHQIVVRPIETKRMEEEIKYFLEIYATAWKDNWGFVPPTPAEAAHFANELKQILDPDFALCCEVAGVRAGCIVAVPDMNQVLKGTDGRLFPWGLLRFLFRRRLIDQGRLLLLGVLPEYRGLGLLPLMVHELGQRARSTDRSGASSFRGCSRTTSTSTSRPSRAAPAGTRPTGSIRRLSRDANGRADGRHRLHRVARRPSLSRERLAGSRPGSP